MLIGVTCDFETYTDSRGAPAARYLSPEPYVRAVSDAGGDAVLLPHAEPGRAVALLERLDGVVISGGDFDIPPAYYGDAPRQGLGTVLEARSAFERAVCEAALERDLPLLAVCGGMQLLNVVLGGTLFQDRSERPGTGEHEQPHDKRQPHHPVDVKSATLLYRATGCETLQVNSTHHQVVRDVGDAATVSAIARDGVVEAIEVPDRRFALGVQWHPELMNAPEQRAVYSALLGAGKATSPRKPPK
jgi:putative glutamine amidotransferase